MRSPSVLRVLAAAGAALLLVLTPSAAIATTSEVPPAPPAPASVSTVDNGDGTETIRYDDGSEFTSSVPNPFARSGSFTWSGTFEHLLESRQWTTVSAGDIWIDVGTIGNCNDDKYLALYRSGKLVGSNRAMGCSGGSFVWRGVSAGDYRFQLWDNKPYSGSRTVSGTVRY